MPGPKLFTLVYVNNVFWVCLHIKHKGPEVWYKCYWQKWSKTTGKSGPKLYVFKKLFNRYIQQSETKFQQQ